MGKKNTFIMRDEWGTLITALPAEMAGRVIQAVYTYRMTGEMVEDDPALGAILAMIIGKLDEDAEKYEKTCEERKKAADAKWANESKDMQKDANASKCIQTDTNVYTSMQTDTDNDSEYDNEYDSDNEFVNDNEYPADTNKTSCGKRSKNRSPLEPEADTAAIPLNDGSVWRPSMSLYETYEQSYPAVNLPQEFNKMRSWCLSNPKNCKTKNGIKRFVNSWLGKAQDQAAKIPNGRASPYMDAIANRVAVVDSWV